MTSLDHLPQIKSAAFNPKAKLTGPIPLVLGEWRGRVSEDLLVGADLIDSLPHEVSSFLRSVAELSPYLCDQIRAFPETVCETSKIGFAAVVENQFALLRALPLADFSEAELMTALRHAKRRVAMVTGLADLGGWWPQHEVTSTIAMLADECLQVALSWLLLKLHDRGKISLPDTDNPQDGCGYTLVAMGKHGAGELNYSSDIDLIAFFDPDSPALLEPGEGVADFGRLTRSLIKIMQERSSDGYVFRSDFRLRPDPGSMPLAVPMPWAMHYYEARGQNWERAALIKARAVAGDLNLGKAILSELQPFVWRRYLDYAAIRDVHSIKRQIQSHRGYTGLKVPGHNVKLGRGGIREIEFFVQTQQLIAGGRVSALRVPQTLKALRELCELGWIDARARDELSTSYAFLRDVEHRLQMIGDQQTHVIPESEEEIERLACLCGYQDRTSFEVALLSHLTCVEGHYSRLFEDDDSLGVQSGNLSFTGDDDDPGTIATLEGLGYGDPSSIIAMVRSWHYGRYRAMQTARAREALTDIVPRLIVEIGRMQSPDETFRLFDRFVQGLPTGVQFFSMLRANPQFLELLVQILGSAPRLAQLISDRPAVFDGMLEASVQSDENNELDFLAALEKVSHSVDSYEGLLDLVRRFAAEQRFLIGIRAYTGAITPQRAAEQFSKLAEAALTVVLREVRREFEIKHGRVPGSSLALLGMGNFGTSELTASSDLDLILLFELTDEEESDGEKPLHYSQYFARLTQRLIAAMSSPTAEGILYELDFRLRPSGKKGPLATRLSAFETYQREQAWTWEAMALTRAKVICGDEAFCIHVADTLLELVHLERDEEKLRTDMVEMRHLMEAENPPRNQFDIKRMKGGLIDLEFLAQWGVLAGKAGTGKSTAAVLSEMDDVLNRKGDASLRNNYDLLQAAHQLFRICLNASEDIPTMLETVLLARLGLEPDAVLGKLLEETGERVRGAFTSLLIEQD